MNQILIVLFISSIITVFGDNKQKFEDFNQKYKIQYANSKEKEERYLIYDENIKKIEAHNQLAAKGEVSYTLEENKLSHLRVEEIIDQYTGVQIPKEKTRRKRQAQSTTTTRPTTTTRLTTTRLTTTTRPKTTTRLTTTTRPKTTTRLTTTTRPTTTRRLTTTTRPTNPLTVDWRTQGYVTPVKDQGQCGSCWAFAATGALEGQWFKKNGTLVSFSEQQLVDCSTAFGNGGCNGGWMNSAFNYVRQYGIERESDYPYTATDNNCTYSVQKVVAKNTNYVNVNPTEVDLETAVATIGPISVAIEVDNNFSWYSTGVLSACGNTTVNHGVIVVGYNKISNPPYWIVKNSWGLNWGNQGYINLEMGKNLCLIANYPSYPTF